MPSATPFDPSALVATDTALSLQQVRTVGRLFTEGNTIPFIARYRKEATGNLDEVQLQQIQERIAHHQALDARRHTILDTISKQGKLTAELEKRIRSCISKTDLEDIYLPYKPKRRTRAEMAREKGLSPLADLLEQQMERPSLEEACAPFINAEKGVDSIDKALAGARDIMAERVSEHAAIRSMVRAHYANQGMLTAEQLDEKAAQSKFAQYTSFEESVASIPSHRVLAIRRGEQEGFLRKRIKVNVEMLTGAIAETLPINPRSPFAAHKAQAIEDGFKRLLAPSVEVDINVQLKSKADRAAVEIFAKNLRNLLLAAPFGQKPILAIDPGLRTGCKCVALNGTGKFLENTTLQLCQGAAKQQQAVTDLLRLVKTYRPDAIAVGNGTAGRETETFVRETLKQSGTATIPVISVNESGASIYSASPIARDEFPDIDLTVRGAISIGRRLQDPLAELVKIDPKSIGVGQYQHDVYPQLLKDKLNDVVVSCVNHVGVELNTASAPLLARVAGIGENLAKKIVRHRNEHGPFPDRSSLKKVAGLGPRTFEQAAGFLRIRNGIQPLDTSAVHPERYELVQLMAADLKVSLNDLVGNQELVDKIDFRRYLSPDVGELTLKDIMEELKKPGRDPRESFEQAGFRDDIHSMSDLKKGMELKGIVTNVTAFGAFVDIGVHQDGLVHISQLTNHFIKDPSDVVQTGDRITVWVTDVDIPRKRIALAACKEKAFEQATPRRAPTGRKQPAPAKKTTRPKNPGRSGFSANPFANL